MRRVGIGFVVLFCRGRRKRLQFHRGEAAHAMSVRLLLQGGGASPMRVLASGADPNNAQFGDLLFDANYRALRLAQTAILNTFMTAAAGSTVASTPLFK